MEWDNESLIKQIQTGQSIITAPNTSSIAYLVPPLKLATSVSRICKERMIIYKLSITQKGQRKMDELKKSIKQKEKDLELALYEFMLALLAATAGQPVSIIESCVFTEEKQQAIGIPPGILPLFAYWIGFEIHNLGIWEMVLQSDFPVFTIEITGNAEQG